MHKQAFSKTVEAKKMDPFSLSTLIFHLQTKAYCSDKWWMQGFKCSKLPARCCKPVPPARCCMMWLSLFVEKVLQLTETPSVPAVVLTQNPSFPTAPFANLPVIFWCFRVSNLGEAPESAAPLQSAFPHLCPSSAINIAAAYLCQGLSLRSQISAPSTLTLYQHTQLEQSCRLMEYRSGGAKGKKSFWSKCGNHINIWSLCCGVFSVSLKRVFSIDSRRNITWTETLAAPWTPLWRWGRHMFGLHFLPAWLLLPKQTRCFDACWSSGAAGGESSTTMFPLLTSEAGLCFGNVHEEGAGSVAVLSGCCLRWIDHTAPPGRRWRPAPRDRRQQNAVCVFSVNRR